MSKIERLSDPQNNTRNPPLSIGLFNINAAATNGTGGWIGALPGGFQVVTLGSANSLYLSALPGSAAVPEPGQVAASILLLGGIGGYVWLKRRKPRPTA